MQMFNPSNAAFSSTFLQPMAPQAPQQSTAVNDANSVETFRQNLQLALDYVTRIQEIARSALGGITNAYHRGSSSTQTKGAYIFDSICYFCAQIPEADLESLKQGLDRVCELMRTSGVGALPLLASPMVGPTNDPSLDDVKEPISPPSEEEILAQSNKAIQVLFERLTRLQGSADVVGSLLGLSQNTSSLGVAQQGMAVNSPMHGGMAGPGGSQGR